MTVNTRGLTVAATSSSVATLTKAPGCGAVWSLHLAERTAKPDSLEILIEAPLERFGRKDSSFSGNEVVAEEIIAEYTHLRIL